MKLFRKRKTVRVPEEIVNQTVAALEVLEELRNTRIFSSAAVEAADKASSLMEFYLRWAK